MPCLSRSSRLGLSLPASCSPEPKSVGNMRLLFSHRPPACPLRYNDSLMQRVGRYEILGELGRGAMGVVYRAQDPIIGRTVAIKTIRLGDITDPEELQRLKDRLFREARSAGIL